MICRCGYPYFQPKETILILHHKSLGMHLLSTIVNFCWTFLHFVMVVVHLLLWTTFNLYEGWINSATPQWNQGCCGKSGSVSDAVVDPSGETLVADLSIRGVWLPQAEALFDVCIVDTDAQSYLIHSPTSVLFGADIDKKRKYSAAWCAHRAHFTPLCFSVDGLTGGEASSFIKRLAVRWDKNCCNSNVLGWVRARLGFVLVRATMLCLRGSRTQLEKFRFWEWCC